MKTILITGGTGLVGKALTSKLLAKGYKVIILTRAKPQVIDNENIEYAVWNVKVNKIDVAAFQKADAIIHLAGAGVMDKKWDEAYKKEIEESRTKSSALLVNTLKENNHKVKAIISASAIGWYGADKIPGHFFTEEEKADDQYLGIVCKKWEDSISEATSLGIRVCKMRTGIVLSRLGGAYVEFRKTLAFGIASILGTGKQMVSWIHIDDLCNQFIFALENEKIEGSYNAVAPMPVSNKALTLAIAKVMCPKFFIPTHVPTFMLKLMLGDRSIEILKSATVSSKKIENAGYKFLFSSAEEAIQNLENKFL
jgi:uncharacterized protein